MPYRIVSSAVLVALFSLVCRISVADDPAPPPSPSPWQKKLIEVGWDSPTPAFIAEHIREMEQRPFDGIIFRLAGGANVLDPKPWDEAAFAADYEACSRIAWGKFTDNFVEMLAASNQDWESDADWANIEGHARMMTKAARLAGCVGVCFDAEPYGDNPWAYTKGPVTDTRKFTEYEAVVRRRGEQFMRAVQSEIPSPKVLLFFTFSVFQDLSLPMDPAVRKQKLAKHTVALLPAFVEGMLLAANPGVEIIDGNEEAYFYTESAPYLTMFHSVAQRARHMVSPEVWPAYREHYRMGHALYIDNYFGLRQEYTLGDFLAPEDRSKWMEHNTYWGLFTADRYVWCYSEHMDWWKNTDVPPGCEEAIGKALAAVNEGRSLEFSLEPIIAAGKRKREEAEAAADYPRMPRRSAGIACLPAGSRPVVDGDLGEPLWQGVAPLEPFVLIGSPEAAPKGQTTASVLYDPTAVYIAIRCEEPNAAGSRALALAPDDMAIFSGDVAEVLINVTRSDSMTHHFALNPAGACWAAQHHKDKADPLGVPWEHAVRVEANAWTAEFAIPWSVLGISGPPASSPATSAPDMYAPRPAPPFRVNVTRARARDNEFSSWAPVSRGFLEPDNMGTWEFK